jgi:redox-sensitive bicupin YhaK (pirin superfamily)
MKYTRVCVDAQGESHFEDVEVSMEDTIFAPPAPPLKLSEFIATSRFSFMSASPGWFGDWHPTPRRQFTLYLQGEIEAETSDGEIRRFGPGDAVLLEDTTGRGHRSRVIGDREAILAVVVLE